MSLHVRPAATVAAPTSVVWNLAQPSNWNTWIDGRLAPPVPEGPATVGQRFTVRATTLGWRFASVFTVEQVNHETHELRLSAALSLGIQVAAHVSCWPLDETSCRLQYDEEVRFPPTWWGHRLERLATESFTASIEDSLQRLKSAAEHTYQRQETGS